MKKFNLALYPQDQTFLANLIQVAKDNFLNDYSLYLLGENSLPHATLCQFYARDDDHAEMIFHTALNFLPETSDLIPTMLYFCPRTDWSSDLYYVGISIAKTKNLVDLQKRVYDHILDKGAQPLNNPDDEYWPHFTLARTSKTNFDPSSLKNLTSEPLPSVPILGDTGENGQLLNIRCQYPGKHLPNCPLSSSKV